MTKRYYKLWWGIILSLALSGCSGNIPQLSALDGALKLVDLLVPDKDTGQVIDPNAPEWAHKVPEPDREGLFIVGVSYPARNERTAREDALQAALTQFLRHMGVEVKSYLKLVAKESGSTEQPGPVSMDNVQNTTVATAGFLRLIEQRDWHLRKKSNGIVARVLVFVPVKEVMRVEALRKTELDALIRPVVARHKAFMTALERHDLPGAIRGIEPFWEACAKLTARQDGDLRTARVAQDCPVTPALLLDELLEEFDIEVIRGEFNLNRTSPARLSLKIVHQNQAVEGMKVRILLPSGRLVETVSDSKGLAVINLPSPAHPGNYVLEVAPVLPEPFANAGQRFSRSIIYRVTGKGEKLACGLFHDFIEVHESASADPDRFTGRIRAEQAALKTARQIAYSALLEKLKGLTVESLVSVVDGGLDSSRIESHLSGRVMAEVREENVRWQNGRPIAEVVLRLALDKSEGGTSWAPSSY